MSARALQHVPTFRFSKFSKEEVNVLRRVDPRLALVGDLTNGASLFCRSYRGLMSFTSQGYCAHVLDPLLVCL